MVSFPKRYQFHQIGTPPPSGQSRHHRLPFVVPYPSSSHRVFSTSPTSHPDSFHFFSYEQALRLPTSFPISGLARLGVKPRLCRSSWRAFTSTHPLIIPSTCSREALLAFPPCPPWNLPSFTVESTLSSPCSRSDPLSLAKMRLSPILTLSPLMIWYSGQTALFLFLLARAAPAFLPAALSVTLRPLFPFRQAQYAQVSPLKPAPFGTLFAGLGTTNKSAISLLFSYYLTLVLSSPPCLLFHLSSFPQTLWQIWQELSSLSFCSIRLQWVPRHSFLPGNDAADKLSRRGAQLAPFTIPCNLSPLTSRIHSRLISDWRRTVSSKYFDTQVPSISTEELVLPRYARCVLSRLRCNGHSLYLGSYLSRIGRIENPSCSTCGHSSQDVSHLILHCPATDSLRRSLNGDSLSLYDLSDPDPGELPGFWGSMVFHHAPIPRKVSGKQQQQQPCS